MRLPRGGLAPFRSGARYPEGSIEAREDGKQRLGAAIVSGHDTAFGLPVVRCDAGNPTRFSVVASGRRAHTMAAVRLQAVAGALFRISAKV